MTSGFFQWFYKTFLVLGFLFYSNIYSQQVDNQNLAEECLKKGDSLLMQYKFSKSILNFEKALAIYRKKQEWDKVAVCYNKISENQWRDVKLDQALQSAKKALTISTEKIKVKNIHQAEALDNIGVYYRLSGADLDKVFECYQDAYAIKTEILPENDLEFSDSYFQLGLYYGTKGDYENSLSNYDKALTIRKKHLASDDIKIADVHEAIGRVLYEIGHYDKSLEHFENAFEIASKTFDQNDFYFVKMYNKLGIIYYYKQAFNKSLEYYQRALQVSIDHLGEDHPDQARLHHNVGTIYFQQGERERALYHIEKTIKIGVKTYGEGYRDLFYPYSFISQVYGGKKGIYYAKKALDICLKNIGKNHIRTAEVYSSLGKLYQDDKAYDLAYEYFNKSLNIHTHIFGDRNANIAYSYNLISDLFLVQKKYYQAVVYAEKAIQANIQEFSDSELQQVTFENSLSPIRLLLSFEKKAYALQNIYLEKKEDKILDNSIKTYDQAKRLIELLRRSYETNDKIELAKSAKKVYSGSIATQILKYNKEENEKYIKKAFQVAENGKSNILKELLNDEKAKEYSGLPKGLLSLEKRLRKELSEAKSNLINTSDKDRRKFLEAEVLSISRTQDSLITILEEQYPRYYQLKFDNAQIAIDNIQKELSDDTTFIEYFLSENVLYTFVITKNKIVFKELLVEELTQKIADFRESVLLRKLDDFKKNGFGLYEKLIGPIRKDIVGDHLIIVPDESLWYLNFDLLLADNKNTNNADGLPYLLREFAISYANSADLLFRTTETNKMPVDVRKECLAFSFSNQDSLDTGNVLDFDVLRNTDDDLPGTRKEIKSIAGIVKGSYFFGDQAIEQNFKNNIASYNVLHLALHGEVDHQNPENSRIYFTKTKDSIEDNILYSHELYALSIPAELVVLSACNTGVGKIAKGEGILSLGTAFQYAGTKSLLLTSWEVSDKTTPEVMKNFYNNLDKGMGKAKALQQAKLQFMEHTDVFTKDPFYWGGFYLVGDYSSIEFDKPRKMTWLFYMTIILIGLLLFYGIIKKINV